jgi:hypothetical protein
MTHIHWVARQNKLEIPKDKDEVNKREIHECVGRLRENYESIKRELQRRLIYEYRCDERLKTKNEESTRLTDTGLVVELEHLTTKTRLIDEKFASVRGECET